MAILAFVHDRLRNSGSSATSSAASTSSQGDSTNAETRDNRPRFSEFDLDSKTLALTTTFIPLVGWVLRDKQPLSGLHPLPDPAAGPGQGAVPVQVNGLYEITLEGTFDATVGNNIILPIRVDMREGTGVGTWGPWLPVIQGGTSRIIRNTANPDDVSPGSYKIGRQRIQDSGFAARSDDVRAATPATPISSQIFPDQFRVMLAVASGSATIDLLLKMSLQLIRHKDWRN